MVNATDYLGMFSSDRRHMKEPNGTWISPPPTWPPIKALGMSLVGLVTLTLIFPSHDDL